MIDLLLMLAVLLLAVAIWLQLRQRAGASPVELDESIQHSRQPPVHHQATKSAVRVQGTLPGHLLVLRHEDLLQVTGAHHLLEHLERRSCVAKPVFERDLLPAVQRFAEFVQLMPASESHHHANVGGLLAHALETTYHAVVLRAGYLLPRNGGAEIVDAQRDYWTYAVLFAALLHDVGKPLTDLRIEMRSTRASESTRWLPMAGSLPDCQAEQYAVSFAPKSERDYGAHGRLGVVMMQRLVPASALSFLGRCPDVLQELTQFLTGEARDGAIAEIVSKADQLSTRHNLTSGTRARFATARAVPLAERLMDAMREMLRQGGLLPLNRDGAAGWVFDGSVWFVAKRLADAVREYIVARAGDEAGIPGEAKNDRLFDCWQEHGQLMPNPQTRQAVWHVVVHGADGDGYSHRLSVLRFALDRLWPEGRAEYPAPMAGRIEVVEKSKAVDPAVDEGSAEDEAPSQGPRVPATTPPTPAGKEAPRVRAPRFKQVAAKAGKGSADGDDDTIGDGARTAFESVTASTSDAGFDDAPEDDEAVRSAAFAAARASLHRKSAPASGREPSEAALAFMRWVQQGLTDGRLKYNEAGALVHFVEAGMALVSPAIFKEYARQCGEPDGSGGSDTHTAQERIGLAIQREVLRAGWHAPNPMDGTNIWTFQVARRGGTRSSKLSAVVLDDPRSWVVDPAPANPALRLLTSAVGGQSGVST